MQNYIDTGVFWFLHFRLNDALDKVTDTETIVKFHQIMTNLLTKSQEMRKSAYQNTFQNGLLNVDVQIDGDIDWVMKNINVKGNN